MKNLTWAELSKRLVAVGWKAHTAEGITGLMSPRDTMFVDARATTAEERQRLIASLRQRLSTIQDYRNQGFFPDEARIALEDTQQLLDFLSEP